MLRAYSQFLVHILILAALIGCTSRTTTPDAPTAAVPLRLAATSSPTPRPSATASPTMTVTASPTASYTPTLTITPSLVAATIELGYTISAETRGTVTLRHTTGTINYLIGGSTADEITWQMSILGPRDESSGLSWYGLTDPNYDWDYACECTEAGCKPPSVTINLLVRYMIPHWSEAGMEHDALAAYWAYFEGAVLTHEWGHGEIAAVCGWQFGDTISALPAAATCEAFDASVQSATDLVYQECRLLHRAYDDQTGHGASQGVAWPPDMP